MRSGDVGPGPTRVCDSLRTGGENALGVCVLAEGLPLKMYALVGESFSLLQWTKLEPLRIGACVDVLT